MSGKIPLQVKAPYAAAKAGATMLSKYFAQQLAGTGVTGFLARNYWINHNFGSHYPNTNVGFDLW